MTNPQKIKASSSFHIYSDLNCPFCFALNERLENLDLNKGQIEWRPVQHAPQADSLRTSPATRELMAEEVEAVRKRAPDVKIALPEFQPNTELPSLYITQTFLMSHPLAHNLKTQLFRSFWLDGADISNQAVIEAIADRVGLNLPEIDSKAHSIMTVWQSLWEKGPFDQRIPTIQNKDDQSLVGFPSTQDILFFMNNLPLLSANPNNVDYCQGD